MFWKMNRKKQLYAWANSLFEDCGYTSVWDQFSKELKEQFGLPQFPLMYTAAFAPIPMGAFYTVAKLPVDDSEKFCAWCLSEFNYEGETVMHNSEIILWNS